MENNKTEIEGLIVKPQFDLNKFMLGKAIHVKSNDKGNLYGFDNDCIILSATPLELRLLYIGKSSSDEYLTVKVSQVVDATFEITFLVPNWLTKRETPQIGI